MKAYDVRLPALADAARVKTCHIFHCWHAMKEAGEAFHRDSFAIHAGIERRHVDQIIAALEAANALPVARKKAEQKRGTRLPDDFKAPDDWIEWAVQERRWTPKEATEEAVKFTNYWQAKSSGAVKLDWRKTWMNWCTGPYAKEPGDYVQRAPVDRRDFLIKQIEFYKKIGRESEIGPWVRELADLDGNVVQLRREA